jgi:hypothetical protein
MTQYDAGPGDWSDRPWEDPERKPKPQAKRRRVILPPWALLVILVALVILICASLVLIIRAIRGGGEEETPTPLPAVTAAASPTATVMLLSPTSVITPTNTVMLPINTPEPTQLPTEIGPGTLVVVQGTADAGLNLREQPTTYARIVDNAPEDTVLTVLEGPTDADGYVWWRVRTPDGTEGWGAEDWLILQTE